ncbi:hypothetical protein QUO16_004577 [Vibrio parahaemolyticus]|uniref:hypothetical protein n=1 Tax=Vibrio parahaemolyticus TaxID=670 RepID=UPI000A3A2623|nr:hypothetical protein [Vibrio parahaemolyticus]ELA9373253.1 hypothetical protein [Vibrio parahaemolyticus]ELB2048019.1 hypothetical protein [Vibrio parahaemolyticus]ELB2167938.1 hypothetical protein [Vibrio parahaemolyticus]ELB2188241.1 hypothetical protein [Vibrio parahaemolyticus]ELB2193491.1 hypothetical protein [Vibrio parahaemolyticus]
MENLPIGVRVYRSRWSLVVALIVALYFLTPTENVGEAVVVLLLFLFGFREVVAWLNGKTILVVSPEGIYHYKTGFISWELIESIKSYTPFKDIHVYVPRLEVTLVERSIYNAYWLPNNQVVTENQILRLRLIGIDRRIKDIEKDCNRMISSNRRYRENNPVNNQFK